MAVANVLDFTMIGGKKDYCRSLKIWTKTLFFFFAPYRFTLFTS